MIRAKDLAQKLGVSAATVSLVLNGKPGICRETRNELRKRIIEMGYGFMLSDNEDHKAPEKQQDSCESFGFVVYPVCRECGDTSPFYAAVMEGASSFLRERGYQTVMIHVNPKCCCTLEKCLEASNVKGFIVQKPCLEKEDIERLESIGLPYVMVDTYYPDEDINSVSVNNEQGMYKLIKHLREKGHERIGYVRCGADRATFCERQGYYSMVLSRLGLPKEPDWFVSVSDTEGLKKLLSSNNHPTAFLTDNDSVAWKLIRQLEELGKKVPDDIAVAGFEDRDISTISSPTITTVRIPAASLGRAAAEVLLAQTETITENTAIKVELSVELIERESTDHSLI